MRTTSALYKTLRSESGSFYEVRVTVTGGGTYGHDTLKSVRISQSLASGNGLSVGGTCASRCTIKLLESTENWPRMAEFTVDVRISSADGSDVSEWITMGKYYTDEREADRYGNLTVVGYDAMLKTEQMWSDKVTSAQMPANWPITAARAATLVADATGIQIDSRTVLDNTVAYIGLDTNSTARDLLSYIASGVGGNWQITPEGKLRLISYQEPLNVPTIVGLAVTGISVVGNDEWTDGNGQVVDPEYVTVGLSAKNITFGAELPPVSGVELTADDNTKSIAGTTVGYIVKGNCNFADNTSVAGMCLSNLSGKVYRPFNISGAILDPAAENGDMVVADGKAFQIGNIEWSLSRYISANVSAPYEEEVDHEYTMQTAEAKSLLKALKADDELNQSLRSYIQQTAREITLAVESVQTQIDDAVELTASAYQFIKGEGETSFSPATITVSDSNAKSGGTYAWYFDGVQVSGQSGSSISVPNSQRSTAGSLVVRCVWTSNDSHEYKDEASIVWLTGGQDGTDGTDGESFAWNLFHNTMNPSVATIAQRPNINGYGSQEVGKYGYAIPSTGTLEVAEHGVKVTNTGAVRTFIRFGTSTYASGGLYGLVPGKTYTMSFDAKWKTLSGTQNSTTYYQRIYLYTDSDNPGVAFNTTNDGNFTVGTVRQADKGTEMSGRCEWTFTIPAAATKLYIVFWNTRTTASNYASGDYIEMQNIMLQEGSKASPWSPAYADMVGQNGASIQSVEYGISASSDTAPTSWSSTVPSMAYGNWLWVKTTYTDGTESITKSYSGTNGTNGTDGADGEDGYTVLLTNEFIEIPTDTNNKPLQVDSYVCQTRVYKGTTLLSPTTGTPVAGQYKVTGGTAPLGISVSHNPAGTFTFSTIDDGGTATWNLMHNTYSPSLASISVYPSINGYNNPNGERGYVDFSAGTPATTEHGVRITSTGQTMPFIEIGSSDDDHTGLYGLIPGETYTLSFDAGWKVLSNVASDTTAYMKAALFARRSGYFEQVDNEVFGTIPYASKGTAMTGRCEFTFTVPSDADGLSFIIQCSETTYYRYAAGDFIEIRNVMLNEGSTAAAWGPAEGEASIQTMEPINDIDEYEISVQPYGLSSTLSKKVQFRANMNNQVVAQHAEIRINSNKIALVVEESDGQNVIKAASIVTAINESGSSVAISADKIQMTGTTTFLTADDVGPGGSTVIDGGLIETGTITADKLAVGSIEADSIAAGDVAIGTVGRFHTDASQIQDVDALRLESYGGASLVAGDGDVAINADNQYGRVQLISGAGIIQCEGNVIPSYNYGYNLGQSDQRWNEVYCYSVSAISGSDRRLKKDIEALPKEYDELFDLLRPVRYRMIDGTSGRYHTGMISQDVEDALGAVGLTALDFAGFCKDPGKDGKPDDYALRYGEFIALCIDQIQKQKAKIETLESRIEKLEEVINNAI